MQDFSYENEFDLHENEMLAEHISIKIVSHKASVLHRGNSEVAHFRNVFQCIALCHIACNLAELSAVQLSVWPQQITFIYYFLL